MKKTFTITGIFLLVITILMVGTAFVLSHFVDPNKFKGKISQFVYAKTGQVLVINGNMHWSLFPWMGLKATDLTYYNAPSFTPKTFVSAKEMDIKVKVLPLITGKIEIGNITLNNAVLNLTKNKSGEYNWQTLTKQSNKAQLDESKDRKTSNSLSSFSIAGLSIKNSKLNWYDQQKNSQTFINGLNISSKHIQLGQPFPLSIQFDLLNDSREKNLSLDLNSEITLSPDYQQYSFQNLKMKGDYYVKEKKLDIKLDGNMEADLRKQTLSTNINFGVDNINGQINLSGSQITKQPRFEGTVSTDDFNLSQLLQDLGQPIETKNSDSLKSASLIGKINLTNSNLDLNQLHAKIDKTDIVGNVQVITNNKNVRFNLAANQINVDDYLSNKDNSKKDSGSPVSNDEKSSKASSPWSVNGLIKITNVNVDKLKLSNLSATLNMKNSVLQVVPIRADLYKGQLEGSVVIDKRQTNKTSIAIKQSLKNINIKEVLHEYSDSDKLSGSTNLFANLTSVTDPNTSFLAALNGTMQLTVTNGSLQGIDVIYQLSKAHAFLKHLSSPSIQNSKETQFATLNANAVVKNGVINTEDLGLSSDYLKVSGKGSTNLVNNDIRYRLTALALPKLAEENKEIGKELIINEVSINISGKTTKPNIKVDYADLAKNLYKKQLEKPIAKNLEKNINKVKDSIKEEMQNKIKNIAPLSFLNKLTNIDDKKAPESAATDTANQ